MRLKRLTAGLTRGLIGIMIGWGSAARAAPPDLGWSCGGLYGALVIRLTNNFGYPWQWINSAVTKTEVTVTLQVSKPEGLVRYSGFRCLIGANGTLTPQPFNQRDGRNRGSAVDRDDDNDH